MPVDSFLNNRNDNIIEVVISKNNIPIRLTCKQWAHITENHDYMSGCADMVLETIAEPDFIVQGQRGELLALKHYDKTVITEKYAVAVYKEIGQEDGFVITAFMTSEPGRITRKGIISWQK